MSDLEARDADEAYILGLWCADAYWWSSSIGLSNAEPELTLRFGRYLTRILPPDRLRLRIYRVEDDPPDPEVLSLTSRISIRPAVKARRTAYHVYVNSRPLLRLFFDARERVEELPPELIGAYFAGRFDGDGSWGTTPRIAYTTREEAETDVRLLAKVGVPHTSVLHYANVNEYCVYLFKSNAGRFLELIGERSWKAGRLTL